MTLLAGLLLLPLNGCLGHHYVKTDFKSYENAFAETSNRELLLNLARLDNRDPAYFFKMGQITSSYRMQGSLTTSGQLSAVTSPEGQVPTGGGSPGVIFENDPTFQFIPVNDDTNARLMMEPIQPETFYALYQQGWRLDQLFRLLVDRIEVSMPQSGPDGGTECKVEVFRNLPPVGVTGPEGTQYNAVALSHYVTFLRVSALVYELQKRGLLVLRGTNQFVPYDRNALIASVSHKAGPPEPQPGPPGGSGAGAGEGGSSAFQAKDQNDAVARNDIWQRVQQTNPDGTTEEGWELGHMVFTPVFYLTPIEIKKTGEVVSDTDDVESELQGDLATPELSALNSQQNTVLKRFLMVMGSGFSLEGMPTAQGGAQNMCPSTMTAHLYMRSIIEVMAASAQEQAPFEALMKDNPLVPPDPQDKTDQSTPRPFQDAVPRLEQNPVLRLQWHGADTLNPLVTVSYRDATYAVTDEKNPAIAANAAWNRDAFRLIEGLSSQVTVDISKFPLPEILQLHSD